VKHDRQVERGFIAAPGLSNLPAATKKSHHLISPNRPGVQLKKKFSVKPGARADLATTRPKRFDSELRLAQELNYLLTGKALQAGPNTRSALVGRVLFCSALITKVRFRREGP
jgi:hypothetical protein